MLISVGLVFGACGGGDDDEATDTDTGSSAEDTDDSASGSSGGGGSSITIEGFKFTNVTVAPGAKVAITNEDGSAHTVTAENGEFDSGNIEGDAEGEITAPDEPGEYAFRCDIHTNMKGTLTVEG